MRRILLPAAFLPICLGVLHAQTTLNRLPLWLAGQNDCNHAVYNNAGTPCGLTSPTSSNDSEYFSYFGGLIFQPTISGLPSYFTQNGDFIYRGKVAVGTTNLSADFTIGSPTLGFTAGSSLTQLQVQHWNNNDGQFTIKQIRFANGSDWQTATTRIGVRTDVSDQGYISFNPANAPWGLAFGSGTQEFMRMTSAGNIGIGNINPGTKLEVNGTVRLTHGSGSAVIFPDDSVQSTAWNGTTSGGDYAEAVDVAGERSGYEPGDVLAMDERAPGKFRKAAQPYSRKVAGIYSTKPGLVGRRESADASLTEAAVPMALVGIVPVKVTAENGAIEMGDLLVASSREGYAMKGTDPTKMMGAVIGKAMGDLQSGTGVMEVLVGLQ